MTRVVIECADNPAFMGGLDDGAFKLIVTSPPCNLGKASLAAKPEQRVVEIVHPSYQPSKVALEEDMRVDARFEEAVDALAQPVSTRHIARPKPGHQAASGTFLHNPHEEHLPLREEAPGACSPKQPPPAPPRQLQAFQHRPGVLGDQLPVIRRRLLQVDLEAEIAAIRKARAERVDRLRDRLLEVADPAPAGA